MTAYHPDFVVIATASTYGTGDVSDYGQDFILTASDMLDAAYGIREDSEQLSRETAALLDSICAEVSEIVEAIEVDFADHAADLDELIQ